MNNFTTAVYMVAEDLYRLGKWAVTVTAPTVASIAASLAVCALIALFFVAVTC